MGLPIPRRHSAGELDHCRASGPPAIGDDTRTGSLPAGFAHLAGHFHADRWDYPYLNKPGYGKSEQRTFTVWFEGDTLVRWEGDEQPDRQPFERSDTGKKHTPPPADADQAAPTPSVSGNQPTL
uniref:Lipoprotein SmpA/OmlA domain-containing protein n=1 Tax=Panagrolaimus superbus TaxID=310955 RepID=A0A914YD57_9BILA